MLKPIPETGTGEPLFGNIDHQTFAELRDSKLYGGLYDGEKLITLEGYSYVIAINSNYPINGNSDSLQYSIKRILDHAAENPSEWTENTMKNTVKALINLYGGDKDISPISQEMIAAQKPIEQITLCTGVLVQLQGEIKNTNTRVADILGNSDDKNLPTDAQTFL